MAIPHVDGSTSSSANAHSCKSQFSGIEHVPLDGPFALLQIINSDNFEKKVDLAMGAYRDENGLPWRLNSVTEAKKRIHFETCAHEYLPPRGLDAFVDGARLLSFGTEALESDGQYIASIQTAAGTGANWVIPRFLVNTLKPANIWLPNPTWNNHCEIWQHHAPAVKQRFYPYYDDKNRSIDFEAMINSLKKYAQAHDAILLHACAHNPTGLDPTKEQWKEIARVCEQRGLFVVFDSAYQGYASGSLDDDAWAIRYFLSQPAIEMAVCQSFSKNMGLYGERLGALHFASSRNAPPRAAAIQSQLVDIQRRTISMPPLTGARIAEQIFADRELFAEWEKDVTTMSSRLKGMRQALYDSFQKLNTPGNWDHVLQQNGMFCYTGLIKEQVAVLRDKYHIYLLDTGRASICGLRPANVEYVANAIHDVVMNSKS